MTIFQLLVYSCVVANSFDGDLMSKTCRWDLRGFYVAAYRCNEKGASLIGSPIFSDVYEDRKVDKFKCSPVSVD
jgi:hypothetical protein